MALAAQYFPFRLRDDAPRVSDGGGVTTTRTLMLLDASNNRSSSDRSVPVVRPDGTTATLVGRRCGPRPWTGRTVTLTRTTRQRQQQAGRWTEVPVPRRTSIDCYGRLKTRRRTKTVVETREMVVGRTAASVDNTTTDATEWTGVNFVTDEADVDRMIPGPLKTCRCRRHRGRRRRRSGNVGWTATSMPRWKVLSNQQVRPTTETRP